MLYRNAGSLSPRSGLLLKRCSITVLSCGPSPTPPRAAVQLNASVAWAGTQRHPTCLPRPRKRTRVRDTGRTGRLKGRGGGSGEGYQRPRSGEGTHVHCQGDDHVRGVAPAVGGAVGPKPAAVAAMRDLIGERERGREKERERERAREKERERERCARTPAGSATTSSRCSSAPTASSAAPASTGSSAPSATRPAPAGPTGPGPRRPGPAKA